MGYSIRFDVTAHDFASRTFRAVGRAAEEMALKVRAADAIMDKSIGSNRAQMWVYGITAALTALPPVLNGAIVLLGGLGSAAIGAGAGVGLLTTALMGELSAVKMAIQNNTKLKGSLGKVEDAYKAFSHTYRREFLSNNMVSQIWIKLLHTATAIMPMLSNTVSVFGHTLQHQFLGPLEYSLTHGGLQGFLKWAQTVGRADFSHLLHIFSNLGQMLLNLAYAFSGSGKGILKWIDQMTGKLVTWSQNLGSSSGFHQFLQYTKQNAPMVLGTLAHLAKALVHLAEASAPYSKYMWHGLDMLATALSKVPGGVLFGLAAGLSALNIAAKGAVLLEAVGKAIQFMGDAALGTRIGLALLKVQEIAVAAASKIAAAASVAFDVALDANPIGIVILALAALGVGIYELVKHWKVVKDFMVNVVWPALKQPAIDLVHWFTQSFVPFFTHTLPNALLTGLRWMTNAWLSFIGMFVHAAAKLFSWVPGLGSKLKAASNMFDQFKAHVNAALGGIQDRTVKVTAKANLIQPHGAHFVGRFAGGGLINGVGTGTSDSNLAAVSHGEYIMPAAATAKHYTLLEHLRRTGRGFAGGGLVGAQGETGAAGSLLVQAARQFNRTVGDFARYLKQHLAIAYNHPFGMLGASSAAIPGYARAYQRFAASLFPGFGWGQNQMPPLIALWNRESGWNPHAMNPTSGAYGIPQALPASKIPGGYHSTAAQQIVWGLNYIKGRYGSPSRAWGHEMADGWYDSGGLAFGSGYVAKKTLQPERVLSPRQTVAFEALVKQLAHSPEITKILQKVASLLTKATDRLDRVLNARAQAAGQIASGIIGSGDITAVGTPADGSRITAYSILAGMRNALSTARQYKSGLAALRQMGLSTALYRQFVNAGVSSAPTVAALLAGGPADVMQANQLQASLAGVAHQFGGHAAHVLFANRVQPARQRVRELQVLQRRLLRATPHPGFSLASRGGQTVEVHIHVNGVADPVKIGREVQRALLALKRSNGGKKLGLA